MGNNDSKITREKRRITTFESCGVDYPMQSEEVRLKSKKTLNENYGVDNPSQSKIILDRKIKTNLEVYGVDNYSKTDEFRTFMKNFHGNRTIKSFAEKLNTNPENIEIIDVDMVKIKNYCKIHDEFVISKDNVYNRVMLLLTNL